ncbi:hypothetical protein L1987_16574 [Smallanthus sonchifolius]|uniref:Uncharacterized protein n=1 Tax=Smallanthus sonchifolius TaxID=185202 RepID=A0ACB9IWI2_9ASTR|nr:hypothetical protein L1987_16574 [Smallanthus sonchifolius]
MLFGRSRRKAVSLHSLLIASATFTGVGILLLTLRSLDDPPTSTTQPLITQKEDTKRCATVEEMGHDFRGGFLHQTLRVRDIIRRHFDLNGAARIRSLPPEEFCRQGFVIAKASEAGFGNEMYKILTAAALSVMLNRSLIIGQTRHIEKMARKVLRINPPACFNHAAVCKQGKYPFGEYISYNNTAFSLNEVKHLWRQNGCLTTYGRHLVIRIDDFQKPLKTNVLCSNWIEWQEPIIWFQNTTDAVAAQFFLKNVHVEMRKAASELFGPPQNHHRPNVFGELMRILISPTEEVKQAVDSVLSGGLDPDITLHMRMLMNRSVRALQAALDCTRKVLQNTESGSRPRLVLVSDTPSLVEDVKSNFDSFAEIVHFNYESFEGQLSGQNGLRNLDFRTKDWGPAPRWVAFVDFFLASRARHAVVSGAHRRVGTTYVQLIAALAAANCSFQSSLISEGLSKQVGWGHVWNRYAGPLSCGNQTSQCAFTPLLAPGWWDGMWQSPSRRDIQRMEGYGIRLSGLGTVDEDGLVSFCRSGVREKDVRGPSSQPSNKQLENLPGSNVLHPQSMRPAREGDIPVRVKNSYNPNAPGFASNSITPNFEDKIPPTVAAITNPTSKIVYDEHNHECYPPGDPSKRAFAYFVLTGGRFVYASLIRLLVLKFVLSMSASKDVLALASLEVDLSSIEPGTTVTVKWRGKLVFIRRRTDDDVKLANSVLFGTRKRMLPE